MAWDDVLQRDVGNDYYKNNAGWQAYSAGQAGKRTGQQVMAQAAPKPPTQSQAPVFGNAMSAPAANYSAPSVAAAPNPYAGLRFKAAANAYTPNNAALQARQAQESAANATARTNVMQQMQRSWGDRGVGMNSGLAMNQEAMARMGFGTQLAGRMQQNIIDNYDKAAQWDQNQAAAENQFNLARAGGQGSFDLSHRGQDIQLNELGYQRGRDAQFDPLKLRGVALSNDAAAQGIEFDQQANPIRLDVLGAQARGAHLGNAMSQLGYDEASATSQGRVGAQQAQNAYTAADANASADQIAMYHELLKDPAFRAKMQELQRINNDTNLINASHNRNAAIMRPATEAIDGLGKVAGTAMKALPMLL